MGILGPSYYISVIICLSIHQRQVVNMGTPLLPVKYALKILNGLAQTNQHKRM